MPLVKLSFLTKQDKDSTPLRDGTVDLETGVIGRMMGAEIRAVGLFRDRFVGVIRRRHRLAKGRMTPDRYVTSGHVVIERRGLRAAKVDEGSSQYPARLQKASAIGCYRPEADVQSPRHQNE